MLYPAYTGSQRTALFGIPMIYPTATSSYLWVILRPGASIAAAMRIVHFAAMQFNAVYTCWWVSHLLCDDYSPRMYYSKGYRLMECTKCVNAPEWWRPFLAPGWKYAWKYDDKFSRSFCIFRSRFHHTEHNLWAACQKLTCLQCSPTWLHAPPVSLSSRGSFGWRRGGVYGVYARKMVAHVGIEPTYVVYVMTSRAIYGRLEGNRSRR